MIVLSRRLYKECIFCLLIYIEDHHVYFMIAMLVLQAHKPL